MLSGLAALSPRLWLPEETRINGWRVSPFLVANPIEVQSMSQQQPSESVAYTELLRPIRAVGEPRDMIVDELYRKIACYVLEDTGKPEEGTVPIGTAFFVSVPIFPEGWVYYAITARHVVEPPSGQIYLRVNSRRGVEDWPVEYGQWVFHPDTDIGACRITFNTAEIFGLPFYNVSRDVNAEPGHEAFFIGLCAAFPGHNSVLALTRFGKVSLPLSQVPIKQHGRGDTMVDAFLIEAASWGGESGSPVFMHEEHHVLPDLSGEVTQLQYGNPIPLAERLREREPWSRSLTSTEVRPPLLGILHGRFMENSAVIRSRTRSRASVEIPNGISVVIPATKIQEVLMDERLVRDREDTRTKIQQKRMRTPKPGSA